MLVKKLRSICVCKGEALILLVTSAGLTHRNFGNLKIVSLYFWFKIEIYIIDVMEIAIILYDIDFHISGSESFMIVMTQVSEPIKDVTANTTSCLSRRRQDGCVYVFR